MALELFKPFVMKRLVDAGIAQNIKSAQADGRARPARTCGTCSRRSSRDHPVMLEPGAHPAPARDPGLRADPRRGQGDQDPPRSSAWRSNADFDGDQMAVARAACRPRAQAEARLLMLSTNNILSPAPRDPDRHAHPGT